jgi:hypothetical protein
MLLLNKVKVESGKGEEGRWKMEEDCSEQDKENGSIVIT